MRSSPLPRTLGLACGAVFLAAGAGCSSKAGTAPSDAGGGVDAAVTNPLCYASADDVISDFTVTAAVKSVDGRLGGWYTYGDKSGFGELKPMEGTGATADLTTGNPTCSMVGSLHVTATKFADWGAATGVDIAPKVLDDSGAMVKGTYDASKYRGIAFWAKAAAPIRFVQVKFTDPWTDIPSVLPSADWCVLNPMMPDKNCSPYIVKFGYGWEATPGVDGGTQDPSVAEMFPTYASYKIDTEWKRFEVLFADTRQDNHNLGQQSPDNKLAVSKLMGLAIQVNSDHSTMPPTANDFEIRIDDVVFIK